MTAHHLDPIGGALHGVFSPEREPILTVDPGDSVTVSVLDAGWHLLEQPRPLAYDALLQQPSSPAEARSGHCLIGPIAVRGARAGQTLEVRIQEVVPATWAWGAAGGWDTALNNALGLGEGGEQERLVWEIDQELCRARNQHGDVVRLRPFPGVVGMPPPEPGLHSTIPPRRWGGNLDCRELIVGSRLFLPIPVDGALLSLGDGHGAQGDGELSGIAVECGLQRLTVELHLHDLTLDMPRAETPAGRITFGVADTLDEAAALAVHGMLEWMGELWGVSRARALALASLVVDVRVTQAVNGVVGCHALLAEDRIDVAR